MESRVLRDVRIVFLLLLALASCWANAGGYGLFSKHEEVKGHVIVDVGDFDMIREPIGKVGSGDVITLNSNCFKPLGSLGSWGYGKKAGLVLVDRN